MPGATRTASPTSSSAASAAGGNAQRASTDGGQTAVVELLRYSPVADELGERFADAGYRLYLVGGSVRDALLGRLSSDLDFTTDARPPAVKKIISGWAEAVWETGIEFGTVGLARHGVTLEVTTFRADSYDGVSRNPVVAFGDTVEGDLVRRDFTANAMAVSLPDRTFVDPCGGLAALARGVLDTPVEPERSFGDDPLRLLRAARFVSQLGFEVAPRVREAMTAMAPQLARITAERVQAELSKLLLGAHPRRGIELMVDTGLADVVLPEVPAMRLEIDEHAQHKDVYEHSLTVMEQAIERETDGPDLTLRLAALLHDIGKPATRKVEPGNRVSFHHHEVVGAKMTRKRLRELRYPKHLIDDVSQLVFLHLRFHGYGKRRVDRLGRPPLRHRRRAAARPAAPARALGLHDAQQAPRGRPAAHLRRPRGAHRAHLRARRTSRASAPTSTATRSWSCSGSSRARGRAGVAPPQGRPPGARPARPRRGRGRAAGVGACEGIRSD